MPPGDWTVAAYDDTNSLDATLIAGIERATRATLHAEQAGPIEISITCVDDAEISRLNQQYLSHDGPTDVISFPLSQPGFPPAGDVYIGIDQTRRQAAENGVPLDEELLRLAIHGTLHILGWTHGEDAGASSMFARQEEILGQVIAGGDRSC